MKVLFVCLGNICRSPAAEGVMNSILQEVGETGWTVDSAGTGRYHIGDLPDPRMRQAAKSRGLALTHRCRQVRESDFFDFDLIIGMDDANIDNLRRMAPTLDTQQKVQPMRRWMDPDCGFDHIPDPYYSGSDAFCTVLDLLDDACRRLYARYK